MFTWYWWSQVLRHCVGVRGLADQVIHAGAHVQRVVVTQIVQDHLDVGGLRINEEPIATVDLVLLNVATRWLPANHDCVLAVGLQTDVSGALRV